MEDICIFVFFFAFFSEPKQASRSAEEFPQTWPAEGDSTPTPLLFAYVANSVLLLLQLPPLSLLIMPELPPALPQLSRCLPREGKERNIEIKIAFKLFGFDSSLDALIKAV